MTDQCSVCLEDTDDGVTCGPCIEDAYGDLAERLQIAREALLAIRGAVVLWTPGDARPQTWIDDLAREALRRIGEKEGEKR
jgi:hypothetical protein